MDEHDDELSVEEIVRRQRVEPVVDISKLAGLPIDDFGEFLAVVRSARGR